MKTASILAGIVLAVLAVGLLSGQAPTSGDQVQKIVVGGTGDYQDALRKIASALEKKLPQARIEVPDAIGTNGGIKALLAGKIDLVRAARMLQSEEKEQGLKLTLFARSPVVFVVHPGITDVNTITADQIVGLYSGKITDWTQLGSATGGKIYAITREKGDSSLRVINKVIPRLAEISEPVGKVAYLTPEAVDFLVRYKGTIGYLPLSAALGTPLRILAFEGVQPSPENVNQGRYKPVIPYGIAYKGTLEGLSRQFVDFLFSPEGRKILSEGGNIPVADQDPNKPAPGPEAVQPR